jgi:hypothetical protein
VTRVLTFEEALEEAESPGLLLGNGFSIAWSYEAFSYQSLRSKAQLDALHCGADDLFDALETSDFEVVIERLRTADLIVRLYGGDADIARKAAADAATLREALASALATNHPPHAGAISEQQYRSVRAFLSHFECVYTLNYDLLLYWACLHEDETRGVPSGDGFRSDPDEPDAPWVTWDMAHSWGQKIHYLHGALHLFDAGDRLRKLTWIRTEVPLIEQIRDQLEERSYPLVVTEGRSRDKLEKILHSGYLSKAMRSFSSVTRDLFVYGHSLAENDAHVLGAIVDGGIGRLYVSVYGDPASSDNRQLINRANALSELRQARRRERKQREKPLVVRFFDATSVRVWEGEGEAPTA